MSARNQDGQLRTLLRKVPKVEIHLHLEGAIPVDTLYHLSQVKGETSVKDPGDVRKRLVYSDFNEFLRVWYWMNSMIQKEEDFEDIAYSVLRNLSKQGVVYVEAFYSPGDYRPQNLSPIGITENILRGKRRAQHDFGIRCQLIVDLIRNLGPTYGRGLLNDLEGYLGRGLIGIGLGGSEAEYPADDYSSVYALARNRGYRVTAHAGEAAGAASIWAAVKRLHVERIGHGLRAYEDPKLVSYLKKRRIPLEVCVTSNVKTRVCASLARHPVRRYFEAGLMVTANSDDPTFFGTDITEEYLTLVRSFRFSPKEMRQIALNAVASSFLPDRAKEQMRHQFERRLDQLGLGDDARTFQVLGFPDDGRG
jgi:adenosine deaminase